MSIIRFRLAEPNIVESLNRLFRKCLVKLETISPIPWSVALCLVAFAITISQTNPLNHDGILYLRTAEAFQTSLKSAMALYDWPFYSSLIAYAKMLTGLSLIASAHIINAGLLCLLVMGFILVLGELGASRRVQSLGALLLLIHPRLSHYEVFVIRGFGYWAFSFLSLWMLIRFTRTPSWVSACLWSLFIFVAGSFRIEGFVLYGLLSLTPLLHSEHAWSDRLKRVIQLTILPASLLLIWGIATLVMDDGIYLMGRLPMVWHEVTGGLGKLFVVAKDRSEMISLYVLNAFSDQRSTLFLFGGLATMFFYTLFANLTYLYLVLVGFGIYKKLMPVVDPESRRNARVIWSFIAVSLLIPAYFLSQNFFLSHRFLFLSTLLFMLWSPFALDFLLSIPKPSRWMKVLRTVTLLVLFLLILGIFIPPKSSKAYILKAANWIQINLPQEAVLYTNVDKVAYYADRAFLPWPQETGSSSVQKGERYVVLRVGNQEVDALLIRMKKKHHQWLQTLRGKHSSIVIFK